LEYVQYEAALPPQQWLALHDTIPITGMMDRLQQWQLFVAVATHQSFVKGARAEGRSPQAATRAVAALEARIGTRLLHRTTRAVSLTSDGERYLERCRRTLADVELLESKEATNAPLRGPLVITAPVLFGQLHVVPVLCELLAQHATLDARLLLLDRVVSLSEEGVDVAIRIGALTDSPSKARLVGHARRVVCASPAYLARAGRPRAPAALASHPCIAFNLAAAPTDRWSFHKAGEREERITVRPRLTVSTGQAAIDAALTGLGLARAFSYQVDALVAAGQLQVVLRSFEPKPVPVHILQLPGVSTRAATAFADLAVTRLRKRLAF
jgi:DNA-binding transcriptional LysR family regulator